MQYPWAIPGAKAVCITDTWSEAMETGLLPPAFPAFMQVYTIYDVASVQCGALNCNGHPSIELEELRGWWFALTAFEPVQEIKDDVASEQRAPTPNKLEELTALLNR